MCLGFYRILMALEACDSIETSKDNSNNKKGSMKYLGEAPI